MFSLLILLPCSGFADICGLLLRHGADVNSRSPTGSTALMVAAECVGLFYNAPYCSLHFRSPSQAQTIN